MIRIYPALALLIFVALLSACSSSPPLVSAVRDNASGAELRRLIDAGGIDVEARDSSTWSPLELAAYRGNLSAVTALVEAGANVNAEDGGGKTPLYYAVQQDEREVATYLVSQGARLNFSGLPSSSWAPAWLQQAYNATNAEQMAEQRAQQEAMAIENAERARQQQLDMMESRIADQQMRDAALPQTIQRDKYLVAFSNAMKEQDYTNALFYAELLERTGLEVDDSLYYFWGDALFQLGQTDASLQKLSQYLERSGSSGQYYTQTLQLMLQAESR